MTDRQRQVLDSLRHSGFIVSEMVKAHEFEDAGPPFAMLTGAALLARVMVDGSIGDKLDKTLEQISDESADLVEQACHSIGWKCCASSGCPVCHPVG